MRYMTEQELGAVAAQDPYYRNRWSYYHRAIRIIEQLDLQSEKSVLEIGSYKRPIVHGADTMDREATWLPTYCHDVGCTPFPLRDKQYDLVVALQVWEHLRGRQREAFAEVIRCSHRALLSFPVGWPLPGTRLMDIQHAEISRALVREWTLHVEPQLEVQAPHNRLICLFALDNVTPRFEYEVGYQHAWRLLEKLSIG